MQWLSPEILTLLTIGFAQLLAVISPGPSFLITARTAVSQSKMEGIKVAAGLTVGTVIWAGAVLFGINAILHAVPFLLTGVKIAGALFLCWIAWKIFIHASEPLAMAPDVGDGKGAGNFRRGLLVQLGNPKVMVFFGSIFVALWPENPPLWMTLAVWFIVSFNEFWWYTAVSLFFGTGPVRSFYLRAKAWIDRVTGAFLGVLGLRLLWGAISDA